MFNKKRIVVFVTFILLMFFMSTFAGGPVQNASIVTRDVIFTDGFNGENISEQKVELGKAANVPDSPKHRNFVFAGWFEFDDHDVRVENFDRIMEDTHVIALYDADINNNGIADKNDQYFTVRFIDSISGSILKSERVLTGMDATAPTPAQKEGYTFAGWDKAYTNVTRNLDVNTVYNQKEVIDEKITHTITFVDGETGKVIATQEVEEGLSATTPESPEHDKRVFDYYEGDFTNVTEDETIVIIYTDDKNDNDIKDYLEPHYVVEFKYVGNGKLVGETKYTNILTDLTFEEAGIIVPTAEPKNEYYDAKGGDPEIVTKVTDNAAYTMTFGPIHDENNNGIADEEEYFNVNTEASENGTALPAHQSINYGKDAETIVFAPEGGYTIKSLKVDGTELTTEGEARTSFIENGYTFKNVKEDHKLVVTFGEDENTNNIPDDEEEPFVISTSVNGGNGTVSPNGDTEMLPGESLLVTFKPDVNYTIKSLLVDDKELTTKEEARESFLTNGYAFNEVDSNHALVVSYGIDINGNNIPDDEEYRIITYTDGVNGSVFEDVVFDTALDGDPTPEFTGNLERTDYVFSGWNPEVAKVVESDATYTATWKDDKNNNNIPDDEETYKVIFKDGEEVLKTVENLKLGDTVEEYSPEKEDYLFIEWTPEFQVTVRAEDSNANSEIIYVATWKDDKNNNNTPDDEETYKVIFKDGEEVLKTVENLKLGDTVEEYTATRPATAQYTYIFNGWTPEFQATVRAEDSNANSEIIYEAVFANRLNEYTVIFANEGTIILRETVAYGNAATEPAITPTKPATDQYTYTFVGWDKDFSYITGNLTVNAVYRNTVNEYTVKFVNEDGTEISSAEYEYGTVASDIVVPEDPEKASTAQYTYTFAGWTPEIANVTGNATYTATYTSTTNEYLIKFVNEDGTELQSSNVAYGETPSYTGATPEKASTAEYEYTFAGWTPEIASVTGNATYTATYTSAVRNYTVKFVNEDGTEISSAEYEYGTVASDIVVPEDPEKAATAQYTYTFAGWTPEIANVTGNATYTATYTSTVRSYTVTFKSDDSVLKTETVSYGNAATAPANPTKENWTFKEWDKDFSNITGDLTVNAVYTPNQIGIRVEELPNVNWVFQKGTTVNLTTLIIVFEVYADGSEIATTSYTNDLSTAEVGDDIPLTITENGFTDTSITYKVQNEEAAQTKFEIILRTDNKFYRTKKSNCTKNCNVSPNVTQETLTHKIFEVIEHYDQNIKVTSVVANYNSGSKTLTNLYAGTYQPFGEYNSYGVVRWSRVVTSGSWWNQTESSYDPTYIYGIGTRYDNLTDDVSNDTNVANTIEITYIRKNYGTYKVTFKPINGEYKAIDEVKISNVSTW